jgi:hypothetical protein
MNTIANKITALPDSSAAAQLPEPPAEVRIDHADLPATGATSLHDQIEEIVLAQISELGRSIDKKIERAINDYDYGDVVSEIVRNMSFSIDVE